MLQRHCICVSKMTFWHITESSVSEEKRNLWKPLPVTSTEGHWPTVSQFQKQRWKVHSQQNGSSSNRACRVPDNRYWRTLKKWMVSYILPSLDALHGSRLLIWYWRYIKYKSDYSHNIRVNPHNSKGKLKIFKLYFGIIYYCNNLPYKN